MPLPSTVLFDREALLAVGLFNRTLLAVEDYECFTRFVRRFPIVVDESILVAYRLHERNLHLNVELMEISLARYRELVRESPENYSPAALRALAGDSVYSA